MEPRNHGASSLITAQAHQSCTQLHSQNAGVVRRRTARLRMGSFVTNGVTRDTIIIFTQTLYNITLYHLVMRVMAIQNCN